MTKLLLVDDEVNILNLIKKYAEYEGFDVFFAHDGKEAVQLCEKENFDIIIMDLMMPNMNGYQAISIIKEKLDIPIIVLTAKGQEYDKIKGFDLGIDDYVVKPFSVKELMKRINAILRRSHKIDQKIAVFDGLYIDYSAMIVRIDKKIIDLSPKEYKLLFYLSKNQNIVLSREKLIIEVWGYDYDKDERTLDTHIKLLRKRLGKYSCFIKTVRGVGYRFDSQVKDV
ncbi:MAG: response regulator transcription factor [Erysipelotrichaceae bacterium]|nr:response regulator transcription factor [Erysipelotrichaceae bacterium]MDD3923495.1 response regulator transcription factor [Erysipelotrichaceae bacterium]